MTTLHDFGGVMERPLNTFFLALTINVRGEPVFSVMTANWFCEKSG
jgi:hypothetical protein